MRLRFYLLISISILFNIGTVFADRTVLGGSGGGLPVGASTEAKQDDQETSLNAIQSAVEGTLIVSASSSALPSGASTSVGQVLINNTLGTTNNKLDTVNTNITSSNAKLDDVRTATEKIDDLQGALKSQDSDELVTRVTDSSGTEIDPATSGNQTTTNTNLTSNLTKLQAIRTLLDILDDWDESDRAKTNPIAGQAGVAAGAGAVDALTQRGTLASDDPAVTALQVIDNSIRSNKQRVVQVDPDDDTRRGEFDNKFTVPIYINVEHHKIHEGENFERHITTSNSTVDSMNVAFKTVAGTELAHMLFGFSSSDEVLIEITESAIWTQGSGTALTVYNNERNSGGNSTVILEDKNQPTFTASNQVIKDVTGVSGGTLIETQYTYNAGLGISVVAESRASAHEWILKADETYVIKMTATDDNCKMTIDLHWYEHTTE